MQKIAIKRVYDPPAANDGARVLVDRLWPRGLRKESAAIDLWLKEIAPSDELRKWFGHQPERWKEFQQRYRNELTSPERQVALAQLRELLKAGNVTLLFAAKDTERNNAVVVKEALAKF